MVSRSRVAALIADGRITGPAGVVLAKEKARAGDVFLVIVPPPIDAEPRAEEIPLEILFEDADLIVVDKAAGMVVHPAPAAPSGTLVNALLAHCGDSLSGIGGTRRPGIVHRLDRLTSGVMVVAKSDRAHAGLSRQFADRTMARRYVALCWGGPDRGDPALTQRSGVSFDADGWIRVETLLGRHSSDRTRMAVQTRDGRPAVTRLRAIERFGADSRPVATLVGCRLETGRTHQIRVHCAHIGHHLVGDPVYGRARAVAASVDRQAATALTTFARQALHAQTLGFTHPATGQWMDFTAPLPRDLDELLNILRRNV